MKSGVRLVHKRGLACPQARGRPQMCSCRLSSSGFEEGDGFSYTSIACKIKTQLFPLPNGRGLLPREVMAATPGGRVINMFKSSLTGHMSSTGPSLPGPLGKLVALRPAQLGAQAQTQTTRSTADSRAPPLQAGH